MKAIFAWVTVFFVLPAVVHGQQAKGPPASCIDRFPYGAKLFLERLLMVADEADPYAVPAKFQQVFGVHLPRAIVRDGQTFAYDAMRCDWYAPVHSGTIGDPKLADGVRVFLVVGDMPKPLLFEGSGHDECLSSELADRSITASGWKGGPIVDESVSWEYRKGHTRLNFEANGRVTPDSVACVTEIFIRYQ